MKKGIFFILAVALLLGALSYHFVYYDGGVYLIRREETSLKNAVMINDDEIRKNSYVYDEIMKKREGRKSFSDYGRDPGYIDEIK